MEQNSTTKTNHGALIGSIVIIIVLVLGAFYIIGAAKERRGTENTQSTNDDAYLQAQSEQSNSDDVSSIEADVNATDVDSLDEGL